MTQTERRETGKEKDTVEELNTDREEQQKSYLINEAKNTEHKMEYYE